MPFGVCSLKTKKPCCDYFIVVLLVVCFGLHAAPASKTRAACLFLFLHTESVNGQAENAATKDALPIACNKSGACDKKATLKK
jgi:hypothetical protein